MINFDSFKTIDPIEAEARGYTHVTMVYRRCEVDMLVRAIETFASRDYLLVKSIKPPGIQIWRPRHLVILADD